MSSGSACSCGAAPSALRALPATAGRPCSLAASNTSRPAPPFDRTRACRAPSCDRRSPEGKAPRAHTAEIICGTPVAGMLASRRPLVPQPVAPVSHPAARRTEPCTQWASPLNGAAVRQFDLSRVAGAHVARDNASGDPGRSAARRSGSFLLVRWVGRIGSRNGVRNDLVCQIRGKTVKGAGQPFHPLHKVASLSE